ncbi:MAG: hypothetical protein V3U84_00030 [Thiotrichaceae bacterium]
MKKEYHFLVLENVSINGILFNKGSVVARTDKDFVEKLSKSQATKNLTVADEKPKADNRSS